MTLLHDSAKLKVLTQLFPGMKANNTDFRHHQNTEIHHRRILLPLRATQSELIKHKRDQIVENIVAGSLVNDETKFLVGMFSIAICLCV